MKVMKIYIKRQLLLSLKGSLGITSGKVFAREKKKDRCTGVTWPLEDKSVQFSSAAQSCPTLCDPMDCSTPGLPVPHQLLEFTQTLAHWVGDDIQPSHPLSSLLLPPSIFPSIRVFSNDSALHIRWPNIGVSASASALLMNIQDWFPLG